MAETRQGRPSSKYGALPLPPPPPDTEVFKGRGGQAARVDGGLALPEGALAGAAAVRDAMEDEEEGEAEDGDADEHAEEDLQDG